MRTTTRKFASAVRSRLRHSAEGEEGSVLLLVIFYAALSIALIFLVVAATSLYLERKRLFTLADGAALDGAESFAINDVERTPNGYRPQLHADEVRRAVQRYVEATPHDQFTRLRVERAGAVDGRSATVELSAYWTPPLVTLFVPDGVKIDVTAVARSVFS